MRWKRNRIGVPQNPKSSDRVLTSTYKKTAKINRALYPLTSQIFCSRTLKITLYSLRLARLWKTHQGGRILKRLKESLHLRRIVHDSAIKKMFHSTVTTREETWNPDVIKILEQNRVTVLRLFYIFKANIDLSGFRRLCMLCRLASTGIIFDKIRHFAPNGDERSCAKRAKKFLGPPRRDLERKRQCYIRRMIRRKRRSNTDGRATNY
uniref:Uncharacterized protein n=1 Tax=Romanomermis culicivorax TaxID=13658 RepID=A0A915I567_ROMCU